MYIKTKLDVGKNKVVHFTAPEDARSGSGSGWNLSSSYQSSCSNPSNSRLNSFDSGFSQPKSRQNWISSSGFPSKYTNLSSSCSKSLDCRFSQPKSGQALGCGSGSGFLSSYTRLSSSCSKSLKCDVSQPKSGDSSSSSSYPSQNLPASCPNIPDCGFQKDNSGVILSCLDCFLGTGSLCVYQYYGELESGLMFKLRGGTFTLAKSDPPAEVIHRAMYLLQNGFGTYNVVKNNCEDFALYCKTGLRINGKPATGSSGQVNYLSNVASSWKDILCSTLKICGCSSMSIVTLALGMHLINIFRSDIGVRDDVVKVKVEELEFD